MGIFDKQVGLTGMESGQEEDYMSLDLVAENVKGITRSN